MASLSITNTNNKDRITVLLKELSPYYMPELTDVVNIESYASKLAKNAQVLIAQINDKDIGIAAIYTNDITKKTFLSTIGIKPEYSGNGYGGMLLKIVFSISKECGMKEIVLEVNSNNKPAVKLYSKYGFNKCTNSKNENSYNNSIFMAKIL